MIHLGAFRISTRRAILVSAFISSSLFLAAGLAACDSGSSSGGGSVSNPAPTQAGNTTRSAGDPTRGQAVFARYCNACHPGGAQGSGPSLIQRMPHTSDEEVRDAVRGGRGRMPPYTTDQISDSELTDLIAYLRTLK
jgi:mono/diheme cytochrome c family protein